MNGFIVCRSVVNFSFLISVSLNSILFLARVRWKHSLASLVLHYHDRHEMRALAVSQKSSLILPTRIRPSERAIQAV